MKTLETSIPMLVKARAYLDDQEAKGTLEGWMLQDSRTAHELLALVKGAARLIDLGGQASQDWHDRAAPWLAPEDLNQP